MFSPPQPLSLLKPDAWHFLWFNWVHFNASTEECIKSQVYLEVLMKESKYKWDVIFVPFQGCHYWPVHFIWKCTCTSHLRCRKKAKKSMLNLHANMHCCRNTATYFLSHDIKGTKKTHAEGLVQVVFKFILENCKN